MLRRRRSGHAGSRLSPASLSATQLSLVSTFLTELFASALLCVSSKSTLSPRSVRSSILARCKGHARSDRYWPLISVLSTSLEINHKAMDIVKKSQAGGGVAVKIEHAVYQSAKMFGRHFDDKDEIVAHITRQSIDVLKVRRSDFESRIRLIRLPVGDLQGRCQQ
jgi:hypothetical protein